jgi:HD-like signal output (HDOD) protein
METQKPKPDIAAAVAEYVDTLPPVPELVLRLRAAVSHSDATFTDVVPLLERDPGLSADLLKFANSARYGVSHQVDSIREAVLYIGMNTLAQLVAATFLQRTLMTAFSFIQGMRQYVDHSREIAARSHTLAIRAGLPTVQQERAGLIGLLHDMGRLVLLLAADETIFHSVHTTPELMSEVIGHEQDIWGLDHCLVGASICRKWEFPDIFATAIEGHHGPWNKETVCTESALIFLAHFAGMTGIEPRIARTMPPALFEQLHLTPKDVATP